MGGPKSRAWPLGTEELHGGHRVSKEVTEAEHGTNQHAGGGVAVLHTRRERERERERELKRRALTSSITLQIYKYMPHSMSTAQSTQEHEFHFIFVEQPKNKYIHIV